MPTATSASPSVFRGTDTHLCSFPLDVSITSVGRTATVFGLWLVGDATVTLRNATSGRTATLRAAGSYSISPANGTVRFSGQRLWFLAGSSEVPFLATSGTGSLVAPAYILSAPGLKERIVDPCALVASAGPAPEPRSTRAPWGLPTDVLTHLRSAGLTPLIGGLVRHDHVHLDVFIDGRKVTVPAGVGLAEPVDRGPCPPGDREGDCATGHFFTAAVANSPLHTHSTSGIIHIESDRAGRFTLGEFFDEWGVRFDAACIGAYCAGGGSELRVFVNGREFSGDPRSVVLTNRQEIAVLFGPTRDLRSPPARFTGGWPGLGCGGVGEASCLP